MADLRVLRGRGLVRLRHSDLGALRRAAAHTGVLAATGEGPGPVEALVRAAVENLGGGSLGDAAVHTFGLARGHRDRPAADRRKRAALVYGVSVERFRKHHEKVVMEQVAEEILKLCEASRQPRAVKPPEFSRRVDLTGEVGGARFPIVVHTEPAELLYDVDILVVPQNTYLAMPQPFKTSVAAAVRRAGARRAADGEVVSDVVDEELRAWLAKHGRPGLPVAAGTVAPTSPGELSGQGIRRLYHAALASPRSGSNDYDIDPAAVSQAVRNVLELARAERGDFDPPLRSLAFPLLGAGRGGLAPETSFAWLWAAVERDFAVHAPWELHFITRHRAVADLITARLAAAGAICGEPG